MILAIETSSIVCGLSLHEVDICVAESYLEEERVHAEKLAILCADLLQAHKLTVPKLEAVLVSAGPGSFTGLRIGMSFAKGLVYPHKIPLAAVNSMHAYVASCRDQNNPEEEPLWLISSHRDLAYMAAYSADFPRLQIHLGKIGDISRHYPKCRHIISNIDLGDLSPGIRISRRSLLPSMIGDYYRLYMPGSATRDYDSLELEYGMAYKAKEWTGRDLRNGE